MMLLVLVRRIVPLLLLITLAWLGASGFGCAEEKKGPKICTYEHECKESERCIFDDPSCVARTGQCKGLCIPQEPIPEKKCDCKGDEDCNEPFESCAACQCIKHPVIPCDTDKDCVRGWYCIGSGTDKKVCVARTVCQKDEECPHGRVCRGNSCCDPTTNKCPGTCKEGIPCEADIDCFTCNMRCKEKKCTFDSTNPCEGMKCTKDEECKSCSGTCKAGYCVQ